MDIYQSGEPCTEPRPFMLLIHGGAFFIGSKTSELWPEIGAELASRGIVAASINYRLQGDDPVPSAEFGPVLDDLIAAFPGAENDPDSVARANAIVSSFEDATNAIRFLIDEADELCIDPERFGMWGSSAGAAIALHVGYGLDEHSISVPKPDVVSDYWGAFFINGLIADDDAPVLIVHGDQDGTVEFERALDIEAQAITLGLDHSFYTIADGLHGFTGSGVATLEFEGTTLLDLTYDFLEDHLQGNDPVYQTITVTLGGE